MEYLKKLTVNEEKLRDLYLRNIAIGKIQGPPTGFPSIDKVWLKNYDEEALLKSVPEVSMYQLAYESNKDNLDKVALDIRTSANDFKQGIKITYRNFFKKVHKFAKALKGIGTEISEKNLLILPNVPEARYLIYANSYVGSVSYPISPLLPVSQLEQIIEKNDINTVFIFAPFYEKYESALKHDSVKNIVMLDGMESLPLPLKVVQNVFGKNGKKKYSDSRMMSLRDFCRFGKDVEDFAPFYEENHITAIIGTSGTTGTSKGVCLTDKQVNSVAFAYKNGDYFEGNFLDALLPSIGYGISMIHYQTYDGRYVYLMPELLTTRMADAVATLKPDNFPGGPVHYVNLVNSDLFKTGKMPMVENFISGGATLPKVVEETLNSVDSTYSENGIDDINDNLIVRQGFGLSENTAVGAYCKRGAYKFGSIGIPIIYQNVGIFKPGTDEELGYNENGEICITGPTVMECYLDNEQETNNVIKIHRDGKRWIHTQDIGYMDETGHLFHVDRIKNIFMRTGFNVHPGKIAEFISTLPYIRNVAVIGFDHPLEQTVPVAFIEIDENSNINQEEIRKMVMNSCFENLEEPSVPVECIVLDQIPINAGGKIDIPRLKSETNIDFSKNKQFIK